MAKPALKKGKKRKVNLSYWLYRVIEKTGWTAQQLRKCPIPLFWLILHEIQEEDKSANDELK